MEFIESDGKLLWLCEVKLTLCIYCGEQATTQDHVPPRGLIRRTRWTNLWTVPACSYCNASYSLDEEYFRLMIVGALCHTLEADELFDGPISRSMDRRPSIESLLFDSLGAQCDLPYIEWDPVRLSRVANKIACGLAARLGYILPFAGTQVSLREESGRGTETLWAPDFSFTVHPGGWDLWFYDSVVVTVHIPEH